MHVAKLAVPADMSVFERAIKDSVGGCRYELWFKNTVVNLDGGAIDIGVPNLFFREWLESHFQEQIKAAAKLAFGKALPVRFRVDPELYAKFRSRQQELPFDAELVELATPKAKTAEKPALANRHSLAKFVVGPVNRVAHSAAQAIVEDPKGQGHSPLFVHGGSGCGKTHLIRGIEEGLKPLKGELKVGYFACEDFTNQFLEALRGHALSGFRRKIRQLDVLLIDDVQFLCKKRATQEEFLHTLNSLTNRGGKLVLTCDQHPRRLNNLSEELRQRFIAGIVAKVEAPNAELRRQILVDKAAQRGMKLKPEVVNFLAESLRSSVCEIEGAINYLEHYSETLEQPIDLKTARIALGEILRHSAPMIRVSDVIRKACEIFGLQPKALRERSRVRSVVHPRMLVLYLARKFSDATYQEIGHDLGGLNHSTVIAAERKVADLFERDGELQLGRQSWKVRDAVEAFERELGRPQE